MHLIGDMDTIIHKACYATERSVYDILPKLNHLTDVTGEQFEDYQPWIIKTFKHVKEYTTWLKTSGKTKDDFIRVKRTTIEPLSHALHLINIIMREIIANIEPEQMTLLLTGENNFREGIAKIRPYKEDRIGKPKPAHFEEAKAYYIRKWGAIVIDGCEADDYCSIMAQSSMANGHPYCVAHIDKDLNSIPGWHYNYDKKTWYWVTPWEGLKWFYAQLLAGDVTDCITGLYGVAEKTAIKHLAKSKTEKVMYNYPLLKGY